MDEKEEVLANIEAKWKNILQEFGAVCELREEQILVIGCSSSEVLGKKIGTAGNQEVAAILFEEAWKWAKSRSVYIAIQCCEHLNRALVVEQDCAEKYGLETVIARPSLHAGGALAAIAWERMKEPAVVEYIKAHAAIDIGDTFVGMHLKPVVVPVRLDVKTLGHAHITFAKTRPKYIGGSRTLYPLDSVNIK